MFKKAIITSVLTSFIMLSTCSSDKSTEPDSKNGNQIESLKLFFESFHYNQEFYAIGDTVAIIMVETNESELPDSAEVRLQSIIGDIESIMLKPGGRYNRSYDECSLWGLSLVFNSCLRGFIQSAESIKAIQGNGILEVDSKQDIINVSYYHADDNKISEIIPIENVRKEVVNDLLHELWNGTWYQYDYKADIWWKVKSYVISVRFKTSTPKEEINTLNREMGVIVDYISIGGFYQLILQEGSDPIEMVNRYLESDIVEIAEVFTYGCLIPA